jgi:hypothetical protein
MCKKYRCIIESGNKYAVIVEADSAKDAEEIAKEIIAEGDVMDILEGVAPLFVEIDQAGAAELGD